MPADLSLDSTVLALGTANHHGWVKTIDYQISASFTLPRFKGSWAGDVWGAATAQIN